MFDEEVDYNPAGLNFQQYTNDGFGAFGSGFADALATNPMRTLNRQAELERARRGEIVEYNEESKFFETRQVADIPLSKEQQEERIADAGLKGELSADDKPMYPGALDLLIQFKQEEIARRAALQQSDSAALTFLGGLVGSIVDPINIAAGFIPIVRESRYAALLARANTGASRALVRARVGAIEGGAGAALIELPLRELLADQQAEYGPMDSFMNVVFGSVIGTGLNPLVGRFSDRYGPTQAEFKIRQELFRADLARMIEDRQPVSMLPELHAAVPEIQASIPELRATSISELREQFPSLETDQPELPPNAVGLGIGPDGKARIRVRAGSGLDSDVPQFNDGSIPVRDANVPVLDPVAKPELNADIPVLEPVKIGPDGKPRMRGPARIRVRAASAISTLNETVNSPRSYSPALVDVDGAEARDAEIGPHMNREIDETLADERLAENQEELTEWAERNDIDEDTLASIREEIAEREAAVQAEIDEAEILADALTAEVECRIG